MNEDPLDLERRSILLIGIVIVVLSTAAQLTVFFNNTGYTIQYFGTGVAIIYIAAAISYVLLPWVAVHMPDFTDLRWVKVGLLAFCSWITLEEHLHAAEHFKTPEGLNLITSSFLPEGSGRQVMTLIIVISIFIAVEFINKLQHHGIKMLYSCYTARTKPKQSRARKPASRE